MYHPITAILIAKFCKMAVMKFCTNDPLYTQEFLPQSGPPENVGPARLFLHNTKWRQQAGDVPATVAVLPAKIYNCGPAQGHLY